MTYRIAMVALPLAIVAAAWAGIRALDQANHRARLPAGYENLTTDRFDIHFPPGQEAEVRALAEDSEAFLEAASRAWGSRLGEMTAPSAEIRLTLFGTHEEFRRFAAEDFDEDLAHNGGYFDAAALEIALVWADVEDRMGIRHELAHLLVGRGGGRFGTAMPVWLNEGLATWLETADPARPDGPAPVSDWVRLVAAVAPPPTLATLTAATSRDFTSTHNEVVYAYSNLLVAFLIEADPEGFWAFARAAREGQGGDLASLVARLGPVDKLEAAWAKAMSEQRTRFATTLSEQSERTAR